jgi:hypothetical protein
LRRSRCCNTAKRRKPSSETGDALRKLTEIFAMSEFAPVSWIVWALLAALFASLTAIFAKIGVGNVNSDLPTCTRTAVGRVVRGGHSCCLRGVPAAFRNFHTHIHVSWPVRFWRLEPRAFATFEPFCWATQARRADGSRPASVAGTSCRWTGPPYWHIAPTGDCGSPGVNPKWESADRRRCEQAR